MMDVGSTFFVQVENLKPTQMCLGFKEVEHKVKLLKSMNEKRLKSYHIEKVTPVVIGPNRRLWLIDHHHHARSLMECGIKEIFVVVHADLHHYSEEEFFDHMNKQKWLNLWDAEENLQPYTSLPKSLKEMQHDWFRSLAWGVREKGGFKKVDEIPFFEFRWGSFFRKFIKAKLIEDSFSEAVKLATKLCLHKEAKDLPGFKGSK